MRVDFVIVSSPRSGSNNLVDTLASHPEIDCVGEIFAPTLLYVGPRALRRPRLDERAWASDLPWKLMTRVRGRAPWAFVELARPRPRKQLFGFKVFASQAEAAG